MEIKKINCFKCYDTIEGKFVENTRKYILYCVRCRTKHIIKIEDTGD